MKFNIQEGIIEALVCQQACATLCYWWLKCINGKSSAWGLFFYNIIIVYKLKPVIYSDHFTAFNRFADAWFGISAQA